jgi:hypothetical protein
VAFHQPTFWDFLESSACASVSGLNFVPDGTPVQIGLIDRTGTLTAPLASTKISGGRYSFNLTNLDMSFSSSFVVQVSNPATGSRLRAFATRETVNIDPVSESLVQLVVDRTSRMPSSDLTHFTAQELNALSDALDALTAAQQTAAGAAINATVSTIKQAAANESHIMSFLVSADSPGETSDSPGDIGNYLPLNRLATWVYQGTDQVPGLTQNYSNTTTIAGTTQVKGVLTTVVSQTNPLNNGNSIDSYYTKDLHGITTYGDNDTTDQVTRQLVPYMTDKFPLGTGSTFEKINKKGLDFGSDLDGDGKNETFDILSVVTVVGFEAVTVPAGTYPISARVETTSTVTVIASINGARASIQEIETVWYAPGVGPVKRILTVGNETVTEVLTSFTPANARFITIPNVSDLISDPTRTTLYAAVRGSPGEVAKIDPVVGELVAAISVGTDPAKLATSDNGQYLYIGLDGENSVQRINVSTSEVDLTFSLGVNQSGEQRFADDIEVLPGAPQSVAISRRRKSVTPRFAGVAIYDDGVQRPTEITSFLGSTVLAFSNLASTLYGYNTETVPADFSRMEVDSSGVSVLDATPNLINDLGNITFDGGLIYSTGGTVINPQTLTGVGQFPVQQFSAIASTPDSTIGRMFFLVTENPFCCNGSIYKINAFDLNTQQLLGTETIPGVTGSPHNLVRWGAKGLAFWTEGGQVFLVESPNLIP